MSNFAFLPMAFTGLAKVSRKAEEHIMVDPRATLFASLRHRAFRRELCLSHDQY
jgi:hypothetical protein